MENINKSFEESIFSESARELAIDYSEIALDKIIDNEVISDIPIIKSIVGIYKVGLGIKERFTIKKVSKFLFRLNDISEEEKKSFLNKISFDDKYKNQIIEKVLILLDRLSDVEKAEIVGNLFKALIQNNISTNDFFQLSHAIDNLYIVDIKAFCLHYSYMFDRNLRDEIDASTSFSYSNIIKKNLSSLGLLKEKIIAKNNYLQLNSKELNYSFEYDITSLGTMLAKYGQPTYS